MLNKATLIGRGRNPSFNGKDISTTIDIYVAKSFIGCRNPSFNGKDISTKKEKIM